jgi:hypothetical protein
MTGCHFRAEHPLYGLQQADTYRGFAMGDVKKRTVRELLCEGYGPPPAAIEPGVHPAASASAEQAEREAGAAREAGDA